MTDQTADLYSTDVNLEELTVEQLVQRLEAMEKNNEQIKRENQLFESHLLRKSKENPRSEEEMQQRMRQLKQRQGDQKPRLSAETKYTIAAEELTSLKENITEGREKSETLLERLKAILEGTDLSIAEIRKEAFDFGRFLSAAENGRIGKYDAEKLSKYMFDKLKQKEQLIDKLQAKNVSLKSAIVKKENQIRTKDDLGEELKFIDFHQLQIENKKHVKDIDDRNEKLLVLKVNSATTVAGLQELKDELQREEKLAAENERKMHAAMTSKIKQMQDIERTEASVQELKNNIKRQEAILVKFKEEKANPLDFVNACNKHLELKKNHKNWRRKIEIAELEGKKAQAILKKHGIPWYDDEDINMDNEPEQVWLCI